MEMEGPSVVVNGSGEGNDDCIMDLPPGFRFHPTDEEIITHYLTPKVINTSFTARAVGEVDLNKCEPWDLPKRAKMGEKEWYFFCQRDRKYPTGMRTNRATESGYWKATGKDKEIYNTKGKGNNCLVGMKKTLVFYKGRAPKGEKTNWVMHEYRLEGKFSYYNFPKPAKDEWVVCRIFHKNTGIKRNPITGLTRMNSFVDDLLDYTCMPPLMEPPYSINERRRGGSSFSDEEDEIKGKATDSSPRASDYGDYQLSHWTSNDNRFSFQACLLSNPTPTSRPDSIFYPQIQLPNYGYELQNQQRMGMLPNIAGSSGFKLTTDDQPILRGLALAVKDGGNDIDEIERQCKIEQYSSNQSMVSVSQDTGLSTDMTADTSSVISKKLEMGSSSGYDDLEDPSVGPISDLDYLWNY
ncbi:hypothetical protein U1Q18_007559 [Sarracenia purpurea var. burkii]